MIFSIILVHIMLGIVFGNSLVIASVVKFEYLQTVTNIFIANLAVADIMAGMVSTPILYALTYLQSKTTYCYILIVIGAIPFFASISSLLLIARGQDNMHSGTLFLPTKDDRQASGVTVIMWLGVCHIVKNVAINSP